jgi:NAD(P)-dependent dehydrogenase (short-subunit alcohol dehydrogenase family)
LARELGPHGITVNAVAPRRIDTPMIHTVSDEENAAFAQRTPLGRLGTPEDVASAVVLLASDEASFILRLSARSKLITCGSLGFSVVGCSKGTTVPVSGAFQVVSDGADCGPL